MIKNKLTTVVAALILVVVFSIWNLRLIEARQNNGLLEQEVNREILWLARIIYSETKKSNEQVLIAWVARNRVETNFRGSSYKEVALSKSQFSGLNVFDSQYLHNISRDYGSSGESWKSALDVAEAIYSAPSFMRPFPETVRHFYSPENVRIDPEWSADNKPVIVIRDSSEDRSIRFAFYDGVK